jgi:hypothetical protein
MGKDWTIKHTQRCTMRSNLVVDYADNPRE